MTKLTNKKIKWIVDQVIKKGIKTSVIAAVYDISQRRVQQLVAYFKKHGEYPTLDANRRPKTHLTEKEKEIIKEAYEDSFFGARLLRYHIKKHYRINIPQNKIHAYLLELEFAKPNPKKQKKRKRTRYERDHSLSLLHTDWLEHEEKHVIAYEDDASRNILSIGEFSNATTENALITLEKAEEKVNEYCGTIRAINTDRGSQFYANAGEKKKKGLSWYERQLMNRGIKHIVSRKNNPQTNGKIERWWQEYIKHRHRFNTAEEFVDWYNNRIHGSLRLEWGETPDEAFIRKMQPECLLGMFFKYIAKED